MVPDEFSEFSDCFSVGTSHQVCEDDRVDVFGQETNCAIAKYDLAPSSVPTT